MKLTKLVRYLIVCFTLNLTPINYGLYSAAESPFASLPTITLKDGHLIFEAAKDKNITLRALTGGAINVNNENLGNLVTTAKASTAQIKRLTTSHVSGIQSKVDLLEQQLTTLQTSVSGLNIIQTNINNLKSKVDQILGTGEGALTPRRLRQAVQRISKLLREFLALKAKLSKNECSSNPCKNGGTCIDGYDTFQCRCPSAWQGSTCEDDVNECMLFQGTDIGCQNGATCINTVGSYRCQCTKDWKGIHCTQKYDDCSNASNRELCDHGTCLNVKRKVTGQPNYMCFCDQGWKSDGVNPACSVDVDECTENLQPPCSVSPHVECFNAPGSFYCGSCPVGFTGNGRSCVDINECLINNGGCSQSPHVDCMNTFGSRICGPCPPGFSGNGVTCTFAGLCRVNNGGCSPHATCIDTGGDVRCQCPTDYIGNGFGSNGCIPKTGTTCSSNPCVHGTCYPTSATKNAFFCQCFPGYSGVSCEIDVNECANEPCKNGGTCIDQQNSFLCVCSSDWQGTTCEETREACGGRFDQVSGYIKYPLSASTRFYSNNRQCNWIISTTLGKVINIVFTKFSVEYIPDCTLDYLQLFDGQNRDAPSIGRFCGEKNNLPKGGNFTTNNNYVYISFRSDSSQAGEGFELRWNTTDPVCGGIVEQDYGSVRFPPNGGRYAPNRDCYWLIKVALSKRIHFQFSMLAIEAHPRCTFDFLKIYDGQKTSDPLLGLYCNSTQPPPLYSSGPFALVHFHSDDSSSDFGFHLTFSSIAGVEGCGGLFTQDRNVLRSPNFPLRYESSLECDYQIRIAPQATISLTFIEFDLEYHSECKFDYIEIYDGKDENAPLIGRYCSQAVHPPSRIVSSTNTLFMRFRSDGSLSGKGFLAKYDTVCGGFFNSLTGMIKSPHYPKPYPADKQCVYRIEVEPGYIIRLEFIDFNIECPHDYIDIREGGHENGTLITGHLCGTHVPGVVTSTVNEMWITFKSDSTVQMSGFIANYTTYNVGCGGVFKKGPGVISTPVLSSSGVRCYWYIVGPPVFVIQLSFTMFSMSGEPGHCNHDYVEILEYDGSSIGKYCGSNIPPAFQSMGNSITVIYDRQPGLRTEGFSAAFVFRNGSTICGGTLTKTLGFIRSPNFPDKYPINRRCNWIIRTEIGHQISLDIRTFELESNGCNFDYLEIRNGENMDSPLFGKYCGTNIPKYIVSHSNSISLTFRSEGSVTAKGFEIFYETTLQGCGGTLSQPSGGFASPNYPLPYSHNAVCDWLIHVSRGSKITVHLVDVDIENHGGCVFDFLEFYDGSSDSSRLLKRLCKSESNTIVTSTSNVMFVKFRTDSTVSSRGFKLSYVSNCTQTLKGYRGVIESPNFPDIPQSEYNCSWNIEVPSGNNITFTFSHLNVSRNYNCSSSYVEVAELSYRSKSRSGKGSGNIKTLKKICDTRRTVIPPPFNTSTNAAKVNFVYRGPLSPSFFRLEWVAMGCGGEFVEKPYGSFTSPNYPGPYPRVTDCLWHIKAPVGNRISVTFSIFDLEYNEKCEFDHVEVFDGPDTTGTSLGRLCHKQSRAASYESSGNEVTIHFHSDGSVVGKGFLAYYDASRRYCGGYLSNSQGTFTTKNYGSGARNPLEDCSWYISVVGLHEIELSFETFDIPFKRNCSDVYLAVYDSSYTDESKLLLKHCGNVLPPIIRSTNSYITVVLKSNGQAGKGFKANYKSICGGTRILKEWENGLYDLRSPNYPYKSTDNKFCNWTIKASDPGAKLVFTFTRIETTPSRGQNCLDTSYVEVKEGDTADGPLKGRYCGNEIPPAIISEGNALHIYLHNNAIFRATYTTVISSCGGRLEAEKGKFTSPGYPDNYPQNADCEWTIKASPGNRVTFWFSDFHVEVNDYCNTDYLELREGGRSGPLIGRYCGDDTPSINVTSTNALWIKFRSDGEGSAQGFLGNFALLHGVDLIGTSGVITNPRYPDSISSKSGRFTWTVTAPENTGIYITFDEIEIMPPSRGTRCYHYVKIQSGVGRDAPSVGKYCGFSPPEPIVVRSNTITVTYSSMYPGKFKLKWAANSSLLIVNPLPTSPTSPQITDNSTIILNTSSSAFLSSPGYPYGYSQNLNLTWKIVTDPGYHFVITVLDMNLEGYNETCHFDKVIIYEPLDYQSLNWRMNKTICGRYKPQYESTSNVLRIDFITDKVYNRTGFNIQISPVCGGVLFDSVGYVLSDQMQRSSSCEWKVKVRQGRTINVTFEQLDIRKSSSTCNAYVILRNGASRESPYLGEGRFCGTQPPNSLETSSNYLYIKFYAPFNIHANFRLRYEELSIGCGGSIELNQITKSAVISSPNYPHAPRHEVECDWVITSPANTIIRLDFNTDNPYGVRCNLTNEYVTVRDGGTINSRLIVQACVPPKESSKFSTGNMLFLRFVVLHVSETAAFKATAHIDECGGTHHVYSSVDIQSPKFPQPYAPRLNCHWYLQAPSAQYVFNVQITDMDIANSASDCSDGDFLEFRDGNENGDLLGIYCDRNLNSSTITLTSAGPVLFVHFLTDVSGSGRGFKFTASYSYNPCGGDINPAISGEIKSPGFPKASPHPRTCNWVLRGPMNRRMKLTFTNYNLKQSSRSFDKCNDALKITKSPIPAQTPHAELMPCNDIIPSPIESLTMGMSISLRTGGLDAGEGFRAVYTTDDEILCGGEITSKMGDITSYGFGGNNYNETLYCLWVITESSYNRNQTTAVTFDVLEVPYLSPNADSDSRSYSRCRNGVFIFGEGEGRYMRPRSNFCGNLTGQNFFYVFEYPSNQYFMFLAMNYTDNYRGVKAKFAINDCGDYITSDTNVTSPGYPESYPSNIICQWTLSSYYRSKVVLKFLDFELESNCDNDYVLIKNGLYYDSPVLGKYCGKDKPPSTESLETVTTGLIILFRSDSLGTAKGFSFSVEMKPRGCGGYYRDRYGYLYSPNYPRLYDNNVECVWLIEVDPSYHLNISFVDKFDVEKSEGCVKDYVLIEEYIKDKWVTINRFCGFHRPSNVVTKSHKVRVIFRSNDKTALEGFGLRYTLACGDIFTDNEGIITSPGYPVAYEGNLNCEYLIQMNPEDTILVDFEDFDVEIESTDPKCAFDSVTIYKTNSTDVSPTNIASNSYKLGPYCGTGDLKPPKISNRGALLIVFKTDSSVTKKGFKAKYRRISCGGNLTSSDGEFESPGDGITYMKNMYCLWLITVPQNRAVELKFISADIERCYRCRCDGVFIYDGFNESFPLISSVCGKNTPPAVKSSGNQLFVVFKSNGYYERSGFRAAYRSTLGMKQGCGGLLNSTTGVIKSPDVDKDGKYEYNLGCVWNILTPTNTVIKLTFEKLDIEESPSNMSKCSFDYLEIRDGTSHDAALIDTYCGSTVPSAVSSSTNNLFIQFHTDDQTSKAGFKLTYVSMNASCGGSFETTNYTQTITSPNYPSEYPSMQRCRYHFTVSQSWRYRVSFKFNNFDVSCKNGDYVEFSSEQNTVEPYRMCGKSTHPHLIGMNNIWMTFVSLINNEKSKGFTLDYEINSCNQTYTADSGFIINSQFPYYSYNAQKSNCVINITTAVGTKVSLYFHALSIGSRSRANCQSQKMEIRSGSLLLATICPGGLPSPIFSPSNELTIRLYSPTYKYYLLYSSTKGAGGCGGNITSINGTFTSPRYPEAFSQSATCVWFIRSYSMHSLTLTFTDFGFSSSAGCGTNYVEVYDGNEISSDNQVARYCGQDTPASYRSQGNTLVIKMKTSANNTGVGFRAKFSTNRLGLGSRNKIITSFTKTVYNDGRILLGGF